MIPIQLLWLQNSIAKVHSFTGLIQDWFINTHRSTATYSLEYLMKYSVWTQIQQPDIHWKFSRRIGERRNLESCVSWLTFTWNTIFSLLHSRGGKKQWTLSHHWRLQRESYDAGQHCCAKCHVPWECYKGNASRHALLLAVSSQTCTVQKIATPVYVSNQLECTGRALD